MSDHELINWLIAQTGNPRLAARELGSISTQRLFNWRHRGIPFRYRPAFLTVANRHGANLPMSWLDASVPSVLEEKRAHKAQAKGKAKPQQQSLREA